MRVLYQVGDLLGSAVVVKVASGVDVVVDHSPGGTEGMVELDAVFAS